MKSRRLQLFCSFGKNTFAKYFWAKDTTIKTRPFKHQKFAILSTLLPYFSFNRHKVKNVSPMLLRQEIYALLKSRVKHIFDNLFNVVNYYFCNVPFFQNNNNQKFETLRQLYLNFSFISNIFKIFKNSLKKWNLY